jgi:hypothetical protein
LAFAPLPASAHLVSTGFGPVTDGAYHFALSAEQILPIAALALFAGLRGPVHARRSMFVLPLAWLAVVLTGVGLPPTWRLFASAWAFLLAGGFVATNAKLSPTETQVLTVGLATLCALAYGIGDPALPDTVGGALVVFVLFVLVSSVVLSVRSAWGLIAVRVLGSWTAALGLLLVGWTLHGRS